MPTHQRGSGKTGRINPTDVRYNIGANSLPGQRKAVALCFWADDLLASLASKARMGKGEFVMRLIEKAANASTVAVIAITLGMMAAECFDK